MVGHAFGGSTVMPRHMHSSPTRNRVPSETYRKTMAEGFCAEKIVLPNPANRSAATAAMATPSAKVRLCRVVAGVAEERIGQHGERQRVERGRQPVVQLGAEGARLRP